MSEPMTGAERAVAEALAAGSGNGVTADQCAWEARVAVAAARPILAAETLREEATAIEDAMNGGPDLLVVPAHLWLRDRAALRTTTPEGN
jgi:hypothetical protein